ncbi:MAG: Co-chaperonin GroES [Chlamydiales bacterium]|jgi:chaperonin GroES|nr:Co-chaperonin GroES [Chlamydiales bacterium]
MVKYKPLGNRVLVERLQAAKTKGGILLPETAQEKPRQGIVRAAGPGKYDDNGTLQPMHLKEGDEVLFGPYSGTEINQGDEQNLLILAEDDILGVVCHD